MPESANDGKTKDLDENPGNILPLRMMSKVARGFGRGSSDLGIPTANLDRDALQVARPKNAGGILHDDIPSFDGLPCGIYWGFARVGEDPKFVGKEAEGGSLFSGVYAAAVSIGYNPTYNNETKTIEPHFIAPSSDPRRRVSSCQETVLTDFYDRPIRLSVVGYLRPELPFDGLGALIEAIKNDIATSERLAEGKDSWTMQEKEWVALNEPIE